MQRKKLIGQLIPFLIVACLLVGVSVVVTPIAQEKQVEAKLPYFKLVYPAAKQFEAVAVSSPNLTAAYVAEQQGKKIGIIYEVTVNGYKDDIRFYVAINADGTLEKPVYAQVNDTPGIGTKIETDSDFTDQFLETSTADFYLDTISSATISSQAVVDGTYSAVQAFEQMKTLLD